MPISRLGIIFSKDMGLIRVEGNIHFLDDWDEMKAKWAFYLGVADPDYIKRADENRQTRYRIVEEELISAYGCRKDTAKRNVFAFTPAI